MLAANVMSEDPGRDERELRRLRSEVAGQRRDIHDLDDREHRQEALITRLREEVDVRDHELAALGERLEAAEHELEDLRAIRDALTPPELPQRPGLELAAAFLPAADEQVSGDFYLVAAGPQDATVLVIGDVIGHGLQAGRRAAFVRTAFAATAPFSDDPCRLLSWANTALIERKLKGPAKWTHFYLYVILDVFSRYAVGWTVQHRENAHLAKALIGQACEQQNIPRDQLTVHADRGPSMTSKPVAFLLADLGVLKTHNRPYTSTDNPYSEAQFKTLK